MTSLLEPLVATAAFCAIVCAVFLLVGLAVCGLREVTSPRCNCLECRCCDGCR